MKILNEFTYKKKEGCISSWEHGELRVVGGQKE